MRSLEYRIWNIEYSRFNNTNISRVKIVNKLLTNSCLSIVYLSTLIKNQNTTNNQNDVQVGFVQVFYTLLGTCVSTVKNNVFKLLKISYTHNPQYLLLRPLKKI